MRRRTFLKAAATSAAAGAASTVFAVPNVIVAQRTLQWQMATSWPVALDTLYGGAQQFAERVAALTGGRFQITPNPAGKLAPGTGVVDVVAQGAVPIGHAPAYYAIGKVPATAIATGLPFGMTLRQTNAWFYEGGGLDLMNEVYAKRLGIIAFLAGNSGAQMGGWFRREVNTLRDLQGLKMRIAGLGGEIMKRLGVTVQTLPPNEIFQALQTGAVDAVEWVGPYDDERLGFYKVAKFYYYPGWWEPSASLEIQVNLREWRRLPRDFQQAIRSAAMEINMSIPARYDARNAAALQKLQQEGVQLRQFPKEIMDEAQKVAREIFNDFAARDADFKRVYESWSKFKTETDSWFGLNEFAISGYLYGKS
ncbi:MAG: TRAP transporter substrate-binding protein DctP [Thermoflexales bacterium]|nr:TRAP transporter substrate-binding protein DctP [Thermoflexales bacterium]